LPGLLNANRKKIENGFSQKRALFTLTLIVVDTAQTYSQGPCHGALRPACIRTGVFGGVPKGQRKSSSPETTAEKGCHSNEYGTQAGRNKIGHIVKAGRGKAEKAVTEVLVSYHGIKSIDSLVHQSSQTSKERYVKKGSDYSVVEILCQRLHTGSHHFPFRETFGIPTHKVSKGLASPGKVMASQGLLHFPAPQKQSSDGQETEDEVSLKGHKDKRGQRKKPSPQEEIACSKTPYHYYHHHKS
jgi:hypothetical protein